MRERTLDAGRFTARLHDGPHRGLAQWATHPRPNLLSALCAVLTRSRAQIREERLASPRAERNSPTTTPLARDFDGARIEVDVSDGHADELAHPDAGVGKRDEDREVAHTGERLVGSRRG